MTWILTTLGLWFIVSAMAGARLVMGRHGGAGMLSAGDLLFSCAGIGVLFILLTRMIG